MLTMIQQGVKWQTKLITKLQIQLSAFVSHRRSLLKYKNYLYYLIINCLIISLSISLLLVLIVILLVRILMLVLMYQFKSSAWDHCVFSKDKFYAGLQLAFTAESEASKNHNHLFSDFKFSKELNFHSDQPLFLIRWVFLVWRNALLGVITDLQTRHTLVATTLYFSLSYLLHKILMTPYDYLWILETLYDSHHTPYIVKRLYIQRMKKET